MIDGPALLAFITVTEAGSVHQAARRLNLSQTALSRRLQRLEADLGMPLFVRTGRRLMLSPQGTQLLSRTRPHFEALAGALDEAKKQARSSNTTISFGCLPSVSRILLPDLVAAFTRKRPDMRLRVFDASANEIIGRVAGRTADFGVSLLGMVPDDLSQEFVGEDPLALFVHRSHPFAAAASVAWSQLPGERLIAGGGPSGNRSLIDSVRAQIGIELEWRHEVQHIPTAIEWTGAGVAHTIAPRLMMQDRLPPEVCCVDLVAPRITRAIGIVCRRGEKLSQEADILRRSIAAMLRKHLAPPAVADGGERQTVRVRLAEDTVQV